MLTIAWRTEVPVIIAHLPTFWTQAPSNKTKLGWRIWGDDIISTSLKNSFFLAWEKISDFNTKIMNTISLTKAKNRTFDGYRAGSTNTFIDNSWELEIQKSKKKTCRVRYRIVLRQAKPLHHCYSFQYNTQLNPLKKKNHDLMLINLHEPNSRLPNVRAVKKKPFFFCCYKILKNL